MWKPLWDYVGFASLRSVIGPENSCHFFTLFAGIFICLALQDIYNILRMRPKDRCDTTLPAPDGSKVTNKPLGKHIPSVKVWKVLADVSNN